MRLIRASFSALTAKCETSPYCRCCHRALAVGESPWILSMSEFKLLDQGLAAFADAAL